MKEQRGIRNETREKYSDAITLYVETGLSIKQICEQTGVGFSAFSSYLSTHHRDLILKRHNLTEFKNVKLRGKKGQTTAAHYKYKDQNIYNIDDLTAIEMNTLPNPITFSEAEAADAFFATMEDITITGDCSYPVELVRPLAQINVGTTGTPMQATFTASGAPKTFHPFTNTVSGAAEFTWNINETTTETFSADGTEYNYLAMGYVFAPTTATNISAELTLTDGNNSKTVEFPQVEIEANQRSNIAGNFTPTE